MAINTTERAFEQEIEWCLVNENGYQKGSPADYDRTLAMDAAAVIAFVKDTQPKEWAKICKNKDRVLPQAGHVNLDQGRVGLLHPAFAIGTGLP